MTLFPVTRATRIALIACAVSLGACSSVENLVVGDKVDYRSAGTPAKTAGLDVPPDLTQLTRDSRYQMQGGSVSATTFQTGTGNAATPAAAAASAVALQAVGDLKVERLGNQRWLSTPLAPEAVWPQLQAFWKDRGFTLTMDDAEAGVMETEWAENRAKLPNDIIRNTIGKVFSSLYSTGERDRFRTRVERTARGGSEIYISHRGLAEVYTNAQKENVVWQPRPTDPQLEAEMLARLMSSLAPIKTEQAKAAVESAAAPKTRARILNDRPASTLQVDDNFERAWRRVGLALDRSGFTVEDRDRAQGVYFVRYVDPASAGKEGPGLFARIFGSADAKADPSAPVRYRVAVKGEGEASTVSVLNAQGGPENGDAGRRIVALLVEDLK